MQGLLEQHVGDRDWHAVLSETPGNVLEELVRLQAGMAVEL
jgi:hypothetical protein